MTDEVRSWLKLAESDWLAANRLAGSGTEAALCFHVQQCVEKLLKANLIARQIRPPYTHDLVVLGDLLTAAQPAWTWDKNDLRFLTRGAVELRYNLDDAADLGEEARLALELGGRLRAALIEFIVPPSPPAPTAAQDQ